MAYRQDHIARIEQNKKSRLDAGLVSARFPEVAGMVILMKYSQKVLNQVVMVRTVNIFPTSYAYLNMECMIKGCVNGGFDLTPVITGMIKRRKRSGKGEIVCKGKIDNIASEHASVAYEVSIKYHKKFSKPIKRKVIKG